MTATNYRPCLDHVLRWEGGFVDHPKDPGGATNLGITRATLQRHRGRHVTVKDVRALQLSEAAEIYRAGYWMPVRGDDLPKGLDLVAFDAGVNSGPARGAKWLQAGLRVSADGRVGPQTLKAARNAPDTVAVIQRACAARMGFLQRLGTWSTFGRGWSRRVADTEAAAVATVLTAETGSFGVRTRRVDRWPASRHFESVDVDGHPIRIKVSPGRTKVEHDDAADVARRTGRPLREVVSLAEEAARRRNREHPSDLDFDPDEPA